MRRDEVAVGFALHGLDEGNRAKPRVGIGEIRMVVPFAWALAGAVGNGDGFAHAHGHSTGL